MGRCKEVRLAAVPQPQSLCSHVMSCKCAAGEVFRDRPKGLCDTSAFEACVMAYDAWLHPTACNELKNVSLTMNEVAFVTMEVSKETLQHKL